LTDNEQGRMEGGNMTLAKRFTQAIEELGGIFKSGSMVNKLRFNKDNVEADYEAIEENTKFAIQATESGDYVVLAIPVAKWSGLQFEGARDTVKTLPMVPQMGRLIKVLCKVNNRFWLPEGNPSGAYDMFLTWETTESQGKNNEGPFCFVCFAGGRAVSRIKDEYREGYRKDGFIAWLASRTREQIDGTPGLNPEKMISAIESVNFMDWADIGYSCSALGEITTIGPKIHSVWNDRMWIAGEHACLYTNPGFMEGALSSGRRVAKAIVSKDHDENFAKFNLAREYVSTGDVVFDGQIHGHCRLHIPVQAGEKNINGTYGKGKITNTSTGKWLRICGVNHWNWDGVNFYFWPTYHVDQYNDDVFNEFKTLLPPGSPFKVTMEIETFK